MLRRLYIDNFKCFVNFEVTFGALNLLTGPNGSGKSSVAEVLTGLQRVFGGEPVGEVFGAPHFNRWLNGKPTQTFELEVMLGEDTFLYKLQVEEQPREKARVVAESLTMNDQALLKFEDGRLSVYKQHKAEAVEFRLDWRRSAFAFLEERPENKGIFRFKRWLETLGYFRPAPPFSRTAMAEAWRPDSRLANFTAWVRHKLQEDPGSYGAVREALREVMPGFEALRLQTLSDGSKQLVAEFSVQGKRAVFELGELSDGQQVLVALYYLVHGFVPLGGTTIFDEPDNFVALGEIQPWLREVEDRTEDEGVQVLIISHHPEILDQLAPSHGIRFQRLENGWVEAKPYQVRKEHEALTPAQVEALRW